MIPNRTIIRQVKHNLGSLICISKDRKLRIFTPGCRLECLAESKSFNAEPGRVCVCVGID